MAKVIITERLEREINRKFRGEAVRVFSLMLTLETSPQKGKEIAGIGGIAVKELKYGKCRFYFLADRNKIKFLKSEEISDMALKFVRMSEKKDQQKVIEEIKRVLRSIGAEGF